MKINNHRLDADRAGHLESPNQGGPYAAGALDTVIIHYTAGATAAEAIDILCDPLREVSAHLVVDHSGALTQLLPFDGIGWHAGQSRWGERESLNRNSVGIEIVNAGQLEARDGYFASWKGDAYHAAEVVEAVHRHQTEPTFWHRFTEAQVDVVESVCALLVREYGIIHILGHDEVAPGRKIDPGPAYPLDLLRARVLPAPPVLPNTGD